MKWLKNALLSHLLKAVVAEDVITTNKNGLLIGKNIITEEERRQLQAEVKALHGFRIWSLMTNSVRYIAHDKIFNRSTPAVEAKIEPAAPQSETTITPTIVAVDYEAIIAEKDAEIAQA